MQPAPLETSLWIGALDAARERMLAHLDGDLGEFAELLLALQRPPARLAAVTGMA